MKKKHFLQGFPHGKNRGAQLVLYKREERRVNTILGLIRDMYPHSDLFISRVRASRDHDSKNGGDSSVSA